MARKRIITKKYIVENFGNCGLDNYCGADEIMEAIGTLLRNCGMRELVWLGDLFKKIGKSRESYVSVLDEF